MERHIREDFVDVRLNDGRESNDDGTVDDEVIRVLNEALYKGEVIERVDLSGRHLKFLPEPFGKIHTLVLLDLSNNHLQVSYYFCFLVYLIWTSVLSEQLESVEFVLLNLFECLILKSESESLCVFVIL